MEMVATADRKKRANSVTKRTVEESKGKACGDFKGKRGLHFMVKSAFGWLVRLVCKGDDDDRVLKYNNKSR